MILINCNFVSIALCNLNLKASGSLPPHGGSVLNMQGRSNMEMMPCADDFGVDA